MSDQPAHGTAGSPGEPDQGRCGSSGKADPDPAASARFRAGPASAAGRPGTADRVHDFGRFDWFADSVHFGLPDASAAGPDWNDPATQGGKRGSLDRDGRDQAGPEREQPGWQRGWRLAAGVAGLAVTCTLLGGAIGGFVAVTEGAGHPTPPTASAPCLGHRPAGR